MTTMPRGALVDTIFHLVKKQAMMYTIDREDRPMSCTVGAASFTIKGPRRWESTGEHSSVPCSQSFLTVDGMTQPPWWVYPSSPDSPIERCGRPLEKEQMLSRPQSEDKASRTSWPRTLNIPILTNRIRTFSLNHNAGCYDLQC